MSGIIYPKGERVWTGYYDSSSKLLFIITSKETSRDFYFLYEVLDDGKCNKLGKARSPIELEEKYDVVKKMKDGR